MLGFTRNGEILGHRWLQYHLVENGVVTHVYLTPAIITGWNVSRIEVDSEGFAGLSDESISAWILENWGASTADAAGIVALIARYNARLAAAAA